MRKSGLLLMVGLLMCCAMAHAAGLRAFFDRDHVSLGDTVTLNIEGPGALSGTPDLSPLQGDFDVLGTSSSSSVQIVNGSSHTTTQLGIALRPTHSGTLKIPALSIGSEHTQPLTLQVDAAPSAGQGGPGDPAFLEASVDSTAPYVGQQDVYVLKLFYTGGLTGGQLEDPRADGAQVIHLDGDTRYQTTRNGQTYQVVERHYALLPERSGHLVVRGPTFMGQMLGGGGNDPFDNFFGQGKPVQARADDITLDARAVPAGAGTPWLPAQSMQLKLSGLPANGQVKSGELLSVTLSVDAVGQPADRLPEPQLPDIDGARVYPDKTQDATRDDGHWLHGTRTRSFAIVPDRAGALTIPAITLNWWNVAQDHSEQANVPAHVLTVTGATTGNSAAPAPSGNAGVATGNVRTVPAAKPMAALWWRDLAIASFALWAIALTTFAWWRLHRRRATVVIEPQAAPSSGAAKELRRRVLLSARDNDAAGCEHALLAWGRMQHPTLRNLGELRAAISDSTQRAALEQLERVRWQGGDAQAACATVAQAFADRIMWRVTGMVDRPKGDDLPPLYPGANR